MFGKGDEGTARAAWVLTRQVVVLLALVVRQRHELPEQQRVLEHPLNGLDEVGLQRGRVLLGGVPGVQKSLEGFVSFRTLQNLLYFNVISAEAAVQFEVVRIVKERASKGKQ